MFYKCWICKNDIEHHNRRYYQIHFVESILTKAEHLHTVIKEVTVCKGCFNKAKEDLK